MSIPLSDRLLSPLADGLDDFPGISIPGLLDTTNWQLDLRTDTGQIAVGKAAVNVIPRQSALTVT